MVAGIINIGDELLIGQVVNTNASWMGAFLSKNGIAVAQTAVISDKESDIVLWVNRFMAECDMVFITGGLGPTNDDVTKKVLANLFQCEMVFNQGAYDNIVQMFRMWDRKMSDLNRSQAMVPDKATIFQNRMGTAPIMWFNHNGKIVVSLPGVPFEMKAAMEESVLPAIQKQFSLPYIYHKTVIVGGIPESRLAEMLTEWENHLPESVSLAYLPTPGVVRLRLSTTSSDEGSAVKTIDALLPELRSILGSAIISESAQSIEAALGEVLLGLNLTVAVAESCSGGTIASMITAIPGCSRYFKGGVVAYSNQAKADLLGVPAEIIADNGAVSEQVVTEMAKGALAKFGADVAISTSGIAGPDGGTDDKPVGTVWIAVANKRNGIARQFSFGTDRMKNIERTSRTAIAMLITAIKHNEI